ncbi:MAG: glucose-6-phosphate isomerase [Armatimonadota bacterium]
MNADGLLSLDYSYLLPDVAPQEIADRQPCVTAAHEVLHSGKGPGGEMTGWLDPEAIVEDFEKLQATAARLREAADVMVVVGIGGSYLGARTVIEALQTPGEKEVWYAGQTLSAEYTAMLLKKLQGRRFCINVVSKSGTTTEPAVAFRLLRDALVAKVGKEQACKLIVATTGPDPKKALHQMATKANYDILTLPDSVGGRYSVFSAVGLLPIAFAGVDVVKLREGAVACAKACQNPDLQKNPAYIYAAARNLLYGKGKTIELLATFEPRLHYLAEWWKQLYGESEGKNGMGIFPASVEFTTDLHSMGQYIQDGRRDIFETFINIEEPMADVRVPSDPDDAEGLNFLAGMSVDEVNRRAFQGTALAHRDGGVPNMTITLPALTPYSFGTLLYFFEKACGISGYLLGVNPFDQPGVEAYKNNMFALLNKPKYEDQHEVVTKRVSERQGQQVVKF